MKTKKINGFAKVLIMILILVLLVVNTGLVFYYLRSRKTVPAPVVPPINSPVSTYDLPQVDLALANKRLISAADLDLQKADFKAQIPAYDLPLNPSSQISNYNAVLEKISLEKSVTDLLAKNGFAVMATPKDLVETPDDFAAYYDQLKSKDLPIFITSDSLLHYYHIFFDTTLMKLERDMFYDDVWQMTQELYTQAVKQYDSTSGDLQEAAKRNIAYLSVALELLKPQDNQVVSDKTLREEYCQDSSDEEYCQMMISGVKGQYGDKTSYKYFSSEEVTKYSFTPSDLVKDVVSKELSLINAHADWDKSPIFVYQEDFSQYVPRGHYTKTEKLKNYFKAMMWYGRMTALLNGTNQLSKNTSECNGLYSGIISDYDAKIQTQQASLIAANFATSKNLQNLWQRMYAITAFFAGFSDDLGPYEYSQVLKDVLGEKINITDLETKYSEIKNKISDLTVGPKIYSGLGKCQMAMSCPPLSESELQGLKTQAQTLLNQTKGFRLMGQRFAIDSYLFSELVSPYSGQYNGENLPLPTEEKPLTFSWDDQFTPAQRNRPFTWVKTDVAGCPDGREVKGFPTGLDVMALFGSQRAKAILQETGDAKYSDYDKKFKQLKGEIDSFKEADWYQNLYWNWLYVLKGLNTNYGQGYQSFMQTSAWQDKELNTTLASWSELRHDTILYVKQSYTMAEMGAGMEPPVVGYVEPVPEFYVRLLNLTNMTKKGFQKLIPAQELEDLRVEASLDTFANILKTLLDISKKELANQALTDSEYGFIKGFGETSKDLINLISGGDVDPDIFKTVMVADVHTEGNVGKVLEEGVGYLKTLLVAYKLPDNRILLGVGPVFSYYEFKQPMADRLTDEAWRTMLESGNYPPQPTWVNSFSQ